MVRSIVSGATHPSVMALFVEAGKVWAAVALCERRRGMFLYLLSFFHCLLFFCCYLLFVIICYLSLFVEAGKVGAAVALCERRRGMSLYLLFVICYLLFVICCLLFVVCCLLFVVCFFVICYLSLFVEAGKVVKGGGDVPLTQLSSTTMDGASVGKAK